MSDLVYQLNPGPQRQAAASSARITLIGGGAGSGKTFFEVYHPLAHVHDKYFGACTFRANAVDLSGVGSIWSETENLYPYAGAKPRLSSPLSWKFPSGAKLEYSYIKDLRKHQGRQYTGIYFDELTHFLEEQFWWLFTRNRRTNQLCKVTPYMFGSLNPDADSWVKKLVEWWIDDDGYAMRELSGVVRWFIRHADEFVWADRPEDLLKYCDPRDKNDLPISFTFVPALLSDNPHADPTYRSTLKLLDVVTRERLLYGNWKIRADSGVLFKRHYFNRIDKVPPNVVLTVRAWDKAATEKSDTNKDPDYTGSALIHMLDDGNFVVSDIKEFRETPFGVLQRMRDCAMSDPKGTIIFVWKDPGQAGVVDKVVTEDYLKEFFVEFKDASQNKIQYASRWSALAEQGKVFYTEGAWNNIFFNQVVQFPKKGVHDDIVDAVSGGFEFMCEPGYAATLLRRPKP